MSSNSMAGKVAHHDYCFFLFIHNQIPLATITAAVNDNLKVQDAYHGALKIIGVFAAIPCGRCFLMAIQSSKGYQQATNAPATNGKNHLRNTPICHATNRAVSKTPVAMVTFRLPEISIPINCLHKRNVTPVQTMAKAARIKSSGS